MNGSISKVTYQGWRISKLTSATNQKDLGVMSGDNTEKNMGTSGFCEIGSRRAKDT